MAKTREYMALRRQAQGGRPIVRRGGGKWLCWVIPRCCEELGTSTGALVQSLSQKLETPRSRIYRVMRGELGMAPDALWNFGRALHEIGVHWMSGPLALALEPRYDAHLFGVVGEVVLEPMHFVWRGDIQDFLWHRSWFRNANDHASEYIKSYACFSEELHALFESAWLRWYAFEASDLASKECETRFADKAPALARAVSLLRSQQRDSDSETRDRSYALLLHDVSKDIREYFEIGGYKQEPMYARPRFSVEQVPRFNLLSDDEYGQTDFGQRLQSVIAPGGKRIGPADAYRNGWNLSVRGSSGLLALALLDYEREFYFLVAEIAKALVPILDRSAEGKLTRSDMEQLHRYKTWWKSLWVIACLVGPLDEGVAFLSKELAHLLDGDFDAILPENVWPSVDWRVSDLHAALFSNSMIGTHLRNMVTIPDDVANDLSKYSISSRYVPSDYESSTTPKALATVLGMLHLQDFGYPTGTTRIELFWWFREVAAILDAVD